MARNSWFGISTRSVIIKGGFRFYLFYNIMYIFKQVSLFIKLDHILPFFTSLHVMHVSIFKTYTLCELSEISQ